jgi:hypothetical protein
VFGDIGTSPLYTFAGVYNGLLETNQDLPTQEDLIGTFSCIFWGLTLIVCIKYVGCIMRVDHQGEGGTFALLQCIFAGHKDGTTPPLSTGKRYGITLLAMLGCSLLIGDGAITPAMSVLGALEGLGIIVDCPETVRVIIAVVILVLLFAIQRKGSKVIGLVAGPIMIIWFLMLAALGGYNVYLHSHEAIVVSQAFNPKSVYDFFASGKYSGEKAWKSLGGVVLCVTGAEALFADMGHFGALPIAATWYVLVYPALVLQYLGQASMLLHTPANINTNPFYSAVPTNLQWPVLIIATLAAIIASQALISGVFTLLAQVIHTLNRSPRLPSLSCLSIQDLFSLAGACAELLPANSGDAHQCRGAWSSVHPRSERSPLRALHSPSRCLQKHRPPWVSLRCGCDGRRAHHLDSILDRVAPSMEVAVSVHIGRDHADALHRPLVLVGQHHQDRASGVGAVRHHGHLLHAHAHVPLGTHPRGPASLRWL